MKSLLALWRARAKVSSRDHWEKVYAQKAPAEVSWYQTHPSVSMELISLTKLGHSGRIIDVGGGASVLVDKLLEAGYQDVTVLDISAKALDYAKGRLGQRARGIKWILCDIREFDPPCPYDLWHDRAMFHFLTAPEDCRRYGEVLKKALKRGGYAIVSAFAMEAPPKCSGLNVKRYNAELLQKGFGEEFEFLKSVRETHLTPGKARQEFVYCCFKRR